MDATNGRVPPGLGEMGFVGGRNVAIEYRWAEGRFDRMPAMAADLISRKVAVILVGGYLRSAGCNSGDPDHSDCVHDPADPVAAGVVPSLNRPDGTGVAPQNLGGVTGVTPNHRRRAAPRRRFMTVPTCGDTKS
jgi:ABC-type uncharacterized transport system substrate-binding protein